MTKTTWIAVGLVIVTVALALYTWSSREETTTLKTTLLEKEHTITDLQQKYQEQLNINKNIVSHTTVVVKKPDGTVITRENTTEDKSTVAKTTESETNISQDTTKTTTVSSQSSTESKPTQTKYSLFTDYPVKLVSDYRLMRVGVGMRLATTPFWLQVSGGFDGTLRVGTRTDF